MRRFLYNHAITDSAIAVHHTATTDEPWDGPAAVAAMPNEESVLDYCHAWRETDGEPDEKGTYKFPHHHTKGGPANLAGARNGLARLDNSSIPEGDKPGVKKHLQAHIADGSAKEDLIRRHLPANLRSAYRPTARTHAEAVSNRDSWYSIKNLAGSSTADIYVFDEIGFWGISAADFVGELMALQASTINLHLNSPGGEVFDGIAIHSALASHPATVNVIIDGLAASIASVIAMAGDSITIAKGAMMMIHDGSGLCIGNAADMRETADLLDRCSDVIAGFYADRAGGEVAEWRARMQAETWYTGTEAVAAGLADQLAGSPDIEVQPTPEPPEPDEAGEQVDGRMSAAFDPTVYGYRGPIAEADDGTVPLGEWVFDAETFRSAMRDAMRQGRKPEDDDFAFDAGAFRSAVREAVNG